MSSDTEKESPNTSSRAKFKTFFEAYAHLFERMLIAKRGLARIQCVENKLISEFGFFNDNYPIFLKNCGMLEIKSAHHMLKVFLSLLTPPSSPKSPRVKSDNCSNYSTQREKNNDEMNDNKLTDEEAAPNEKNQQLPKDQKKVNSSATLKPNVTDIKVQGCNSIIWATAAHVTRQLLSSEPQPSTSSATRAANCLNNTIKRKMDNEDQKIMDAEAVSIENNQKQKEHPENIENTKVNIKPYTGMTWTSPSGIRRTILGIKPKPANTTFHTISNITTERQINNDDQVYQKHKDGEDLSKELNQPLKEAEDIKKTVKTVFLKPNIQPNNGVAWITSAISKLLDSEPQPSTSSGAISLKRKISNDVMDRQTDVEDLLIKSNQTTPIATNISVLQACSDDTLANTACSIRQLLTSESQPSTSTGAISVKHEISNDVLDYRKFTVEEDLSIRSSQQLKDDHKITDNIVILKPIDTDDNAQTCIGNTLTTAACALSSEPQPSTSAGAKSTKRTKRKSTNEFLDGKDISIENNKQQQEYPKKTDKSVILGPNGTEVTLQAYDAIIWTTAAGATRQLLGYVFTNDVLATHTLTGKPSPAFYGRERPEKMQLNPEKIADVIHCIRALKNCSEREVRAAITTKCSDTSKKYKRHSLKQTKSTTSP